MLCSVIQHTWHHLSFQTAGIQNGKGVRVLLLQHLPSEPNKNSTGALGYPFYARCPV